MGTTEILKGNIKQCESIKGFNELCEIIRICKKIGIKTLGDIAFFISIDLLNSKTLYAALKRYEIEFDGECNEQRI